MKKILAILLAFAMVLTGCAPTSKEMESSVSSEQQLEVIRTTESTIDDFKTGSLTASDEVDDTELLSTFTGLNDPNLLQYVEDTVYTNLVDEFASEDYIIENVAATYVSKEYLEELSYNSQANIFFGYSLAELDAQFQGTRYVFTLGENGETVVQAFEAYDDTYERAMKNVAIGGGMILVCVTVSVAMAGTAPAVSMIFAASAKSAEVFAVSSGALSGIITGTVTGIQTKDFSQALKAGTLAGSESFKWGAVSGFVFGGATELVTLKMAASGGLTLNEAAEIIRESNLPANFVKQIRSVDEYKELIEIAKASGLTIQDLSAICMTTGYPIEIVKFMKNTEEGIIYFEQAGLYSETINGQAALIRSIDLSYESELAGRSVTNLERMQQGYAAIDPATGQAYQLHHIGQTADSPLAILTQAEHTGGGNNSILHDVHIPNGEGVHSNSPKWPAQREEFWEELAKFLTQ